MLTHIVAMEAVAEIVSVDVMDLHGEIMAQNAVMVVAAEIALEAAKELLQVQDGNLLCQTHGG